MFKLLKIAPFVILLSACASNFGEDAKGALTYQEAISHNRVGERVIIGGPIISYNYTQYSTQIEIANAPLSNGTPSISGNPNERAIIVIPEIIAEERLQNVRVSAIGDIKEIAQLKRYGNSSVIMINARDYKIWRAASTMYNPTKKERYGYTYKFES